MPTEKSFLKGLAGAAGAGWTALSQGESLREAVSTTWAFTRDYYVPNKQAYQADGGRYGANYAAVTEIERAQEFAIALNAIAREIGSADVRLEYRSRPEDDAKVITDPNLPVMKLLAQPNPLHTWQSWIETAVLMLIPTGNCYILLDPLSMAGTPMALWLLRPDRTKPIRKNDPLHPVQGYEHFSEDGSRYVFPADRVIHIKLPNPLTDYQGEGMVKMLGQTLEMDVKSMESNIQLFRQGGRLSTVIEGMDDGDTVKNKEFIEKIKQAHMGTANAHKVLLLTGNAKLNAAASMSGPKEADYKGTREDISRATGGMLGVPPLKMGQLDQINRSTATVQQQEFLSNGVWPHMRRFAPAMNIIVRMFDDRLTFVFPAVAVLDLEAMAPTIVAVSDAGALSPNDIREHFLKMARSKDERMDKHYILSTNYALEDGGGLPPALPAAGGDPAAAAGGDQQSKLPSAEPLEKKALDMHRDPTGAWAHRKLSEVPRLGMKAISENGKTHDEDGRPFPKGTQEQRRHLAAIRGARPAMERALAPVFTAHFLAVAEHAAAQLEQRNAGKAIARGNIKAVLAGIRKAYDASGTPGDLEKKAKQAYTVQMTDAAGTASSIFAVNMVGFDEGSSDFHNVKFQLVQRIKGVDQVINDKIEQMMQDAAERGLSPWEIANGTTDGSFIGLKRASVEISQERGMLIARTETTHIQDAVNTEAYKKMGVLACDVIGCEDFVIMPGSVYGCNSQNVPIAALPINFHPNHNGAVVPRVATS